MSPPGKSRFLLACLALTLPQNSWAWSCCRHRLSILAELLLQALSEVCWLHCLSWLASRLAQRVSSSPLPVLLMYCCDFERSAWYALLYSELFVLALILVEAPAWML